eukprot:SAG22_NODE_695_length_7843_cov_2.924587_4_plen_160_part_00
MPYSDCRTNVLSIMGQMVLVFSFFATILLKADMHGELLTDDHIGIIMVVAHLPMMIYFVYDVSKSVLAGLGSAVVETKQREVTELFQRLNAVGSEATTRNYEERVRLLAVLRDEISTVVEAIDAKVFQNPLEEREAPATETKKKATMLTESNHQASSDL